jgi:nitrogen regulatory protein PII
MQRIEAIVPYEVSKNVVEELRKLGVDGITLVESRGQGEGERPEIMGKQAEYNTMDLIITVVNDSMVNSAVSAIMNAAHTGEKKDGKIFVTDVRETYDISSKQKFIE